MSDCLICQPVRPMDVLGTHPDKGIMDGFLPVRHSGTLGNPRLSHRVA
jgi:hypothetical protein